MVLTMVSKAIDGVNAVAITLGEYEKVLGAHATPAGASANAVALKVEIATNVVTVTPVGDAGTGTYYALADCI